MKRLTLVIAGVGACSAVSPVFAQAVQEPSSRAAEAAKQGEDEADIVVTGQRPAGSVIGDIPPEVTFNQADIRSFGVSSLSDLLAELAPQTGSNQGRGGESPVVLLGGKRISGFSEIRDIPTEAIQRVEILPEEVALKYGYRPNQKVVNIVLRRRFRAVTGEVEASAPTAGGQFSPKLDTSYLRIGDGGARLNLSMKYQHSSSLYQSERDIIDQSSRRPYDFAGNIASANGAAIDPALSALLGRDRGRRACLGRRTATDARRLRAGHSQRQRHRPLPHAASRDRRADLQRRAGPHDLRQCLRQLQRHHDL
jgi:iron complex outermembrane receptor protein